MTPRVHFCGMIREGGRIFFTVSVWQSTHIPSRMHGACLSITLCNALRLLTLFCSWRRIPRLDRWRMSASVATGLVGMAESSLLRDFFACLTYMPFTSPRYPVNAADMPIWLL